MTKAKPDTFSSKVYEVVRRIPRGRTMTYQEVARRAGRLGAARAVGNLMAKNYDPKIPCHRVVRADGKMGGYNRGGSARKRELLREEGAALWPR